MADDLEHGAPMEARGRHMSVSHYQHGEMGGQDGRRRSSVMQATGVQRGSTAQEARNSSVLNTNDDTLRKMSLAVPNLAELTQDAKAATEAEHRMTFREGVKLYPKAIIFSFGISLAVIMEGYDTALLGSFFAMPAFCKKYGALASNDTYQVAPKWQTALGVGQQVGSIIGLFINGILSERIGYRYTMLGSLTLIICFIFINFFAQNVQTLLAGYILCGLPWGVFQTLTTTYAAEVTPVALRAYLTTYVNLCWVIGQFLAAGVMRGFVTGTSQWSYRIPYAIQWIWPVPIMLFTFFAPESPWWLVRHGKLDEARAALLKLTAKDNTTFNVEDTLAMMIHTNELETQITAGTSYLDCFRGIDLRRTEIVSFVWMIQTFCGSPMIGTGTYFMSQVGLSPENSFNIGLGQTAMGFCGTVCSWFLMPWFGRRTLYLAGEWVMLFILIIIGGLGVPKISTGTGWGSGALILIFTFVYDITVGPVCYSLVAEIPSTRLRIKSVVLARNFYNVAGIFVGIVQPRMLNPDSWNWKGKTAFFWAGFCALCLVWTYFRLPEPKGLTYGELDVLFENRVSARKFRHVEIDPFRSDNLVVVAEDEVDTKLEGKY